MSIASPSGRAAVRPWMVVGAVWITLAIASGLYFAFPIFFVVWPSAAALYAYALLFGLGFGARGPIITAIASQLFGGSHFGVIYGILSVGNGIGGAVGPWFGGVVHDLTGSYRTAFLIAVGFCGLGAACFWMARPRRPRG
ncbi:MAG: MFS transporter [Candidatus Rokuibacteriota bacterium]